MRVPTRILIVALVPLLAALGFAGLRIQDALAAADRFRVITQIAGTARTGTELIDALAQERDVSVDPRAKNTLGDPSDRTGRSYTDAKRRPSRRTWTGFRRGSAWSGSNW